MSNPYDLIEVKIGDQSIHARPVEFLNDRAIRFVTTCPHCGGYIEFLVGNIYGGNIWCPNCGVGEHLVVIEPFIDPVVAGLISERELLFVADAIDKSKSKVVINKFDSLQPEDDFSFEAVLKPKKRKPEIVDDLGDPDNE